MRREQPRGEEMPSYIYAGAAPWIAASKDARTGGLYRLDTDTRRWQRLTAGLPDAAAARCVLAHHTAPERGYVGPRGPPFRSTPSPPPHTPFHSPCPTPLPLPS